MRSPPIENILQDSHHGAVLARSVWIKYGSGNPTLEAELHRLMTRFESIKKEAKLLEVVINKRADSG